MEPILVTTVEKESSDAPLLIIDHTGIVGNEIYERTNKELVTAFVSNKQPKASANLIYIPYKHHIPEIPNGTYSLILYVCAKEKDTQEISKKCIAKAKNDGIPFIFVVDHKIADQKILEKILDSYENASVMILGELFGQGDSIIDSYILQAGTSRKIKLPYMGLRKTRPVLFTDAMQGILQTLFGNQKHQRITFLYPYHEYTDLSIAHMLQKIDPLIHIDFLKEQRKSLFMKQHTNGQALSMHGAYFFDKDYAVQAKIVDVYKTISKKRNQEEDTYIYKESVKPLLDLSGEGSYVPESIKKWGSIIFLFLFIFILFPLLCLGISGLVADTAFTNAKTAMDKGDISNVKMQVSIAHTAFVFDDIVKTPTIFELNIVGLPGFAQSLESKIINGRELSRVIYDLITSEETIKTVISGKSTLPTSDITTVVSHVRASLISLQNLTASSPNEKNLVGQVGKYQKGIDVLTGTIGLLPHVLATSGKHTYLVLFQDNTELRPGGGVISSYGLLTFDHGKMSDFVIHPVSDADGKLNKHVDAAFGIRRYMGTAHQYLSNSNFDADFVIDAQKASDMFQLETGEKVDGIFAVDLTFAQYLLLATGPISIPAEHIQVSASNFFQLLQATQEQSQRTAFINSAFATIWNTLQTGKGVDTNSLIQKSLQAIAEKHILIALANIVDQNQLSVNQLSSSLWDSRPQNSGIITDYLGINEANVGENKANYLIKRQIKQSVSIDGGGLLKGEVHVTYTNTNARDAQTGDYHNYMKVIVPKDTVLTGISFNGVAQATRSAITDPLLYESRGFKAPSDLEVEQTEEFGKTIYGFLVIIPAGYTKTVDIMYAHAQKVNVTNPVLHYSLYLYKQPGTNNDPYSFSFNFPLEYSILSADPTNGDGSSDYTLDAQLSADRVINVDLTKK